MRFKIEGDLFFLAFVGQDRPDEQDQAVWWNTVVQLQPLLSTGDRGQHGQSVDPGLDVRRSTVFLRQHGGNAGDLILGLKMGGISSQRPGRTARVFGHTFGGTMRLIIEVPALEGHQRQRVMLNKMAGTMDGTLWQHRGF